MHSLNGITYINSQDTWICFLVVFVGNRMLKDSINIWYNDKIVFVQGMFKLECRNRSLHVLKISSTAQGPPLLSASISSLIEGGTKQSPDKLRHVTMQQIGNNKNKIILSLHFIIFYRIILLHFSSFYSVEYSFCKLVPTLERFSFLFRYLLDSCGKKIALMRVHGLAKNS